MKEKGRKVSSRGSVVELLPGFEFCWHQVSHQWTIERHLIKTAYVHELSSTLHGDIPETTQNYVALMASKASVTYCLDISAAYDTIDHSVVSSRLQSDFSIDGKALAWI